LKQTTTTRADELIVERAGQVGSITLNRPRVLNVLTPVMVDGLNATLKAWAKDPAVKAVVIRGAARDDGKVPFCAGGDIRMLYEQRVDPERRFAVHFYQEEYRLNRRTHHFPKPYVALIDGVVMGGGVGASIHGSHRVMSERTLLAMPETGIGLFPDVGATHFFPRCPDHMGLYMGLTGARVGVADAVHLGLGTHYVPSAKLAALDRALLEADYARDAQKTVDAVIADFAGDLPVAPIDSHRGSIERAFSAPSVEAILARLKADGSPFATDTLKQLATKAPMSLKVTFRQLTQHGHLSFDEAMKLEYRLAVHCNFAHDFFEGIRAVVIDKDNEPKWQPARLEDVTDAMVERYFSAPSCGDMTFD
jgi:enoyl-CoA hydratase